MKIEIDIDEKYADTKVVIQTPSLTPDVEKLVSLMRTVNSQIAVKNEEETILLDIAQILYIEAMERMSFVYTKDAVYQSELKLYGFENLLTEQDFIRISKQAIINLRKVKSLKTDINRKIRVTLLNDEQIIVSRTYSDELRKRLGVK